MWSRINHHELRCRTGASAKGSSGTCTHGANRARVGAPLGELREIRSGGGANPKGACGEQYERLCLSGGHGSGEEDGRRLEAWHCPVSTDYLPLSHGTSSQSNLFVI